MIEVMKNLNKKRNQSKKAITEIVRYCLKEIKPTLADSERYQLLQALAEISEGKIFLEKEYSVIIREQADFQLINNNIDEAARLVQDMQIETFGSVSRYDKVDYILYQMRLLLQKQDYIRAIIVSNKIERKNLNDEGLEKLKFEFYSLMINYHSVQKEYMEASKCYKIQFDFYREIELKLESVQTGMVNDTLISTYNDILRNYNREELLVNYVCYLAICPPVPEKEKMMNELATYYQKELDQSKELKLLVTKFLQDDFTFVDDYSLSAFYKFELFSGKTSVSQENFIQLRKQLIQRNLAIFCKYFSQIHMRRISEMIGISKDEVEKELADMVVCKYSYAKINRINGIVNFRKRQNTNDKLNELNSDISSMLKKIENTCHLIHKENLKYGIK